MKIIFLGVQGVGMPVALLVYTIWSSVKDTGKIGFSLYRGHFLAEATILIFSSFLGKAFLHSSSFASIIYFSSMLICLIYGVRLAILAFNDIKLLSKFEISQKDVQVYEKQYTDIYRLNDEKQYDIANKITLDATRKKFKKSKRNAFVASFLFTITSLQVIMFISSSIPSLIFHTNLSFGIKNYMVATVIFAIIFMLSEFVLYFFMPKLIAIVGKFMNELIVKIITAICAFLFFVCTTNQAIAMVEQLKFV